jgi:hypothetical protein
MIPMAELLSVLLLVGMLSASPDKAKPPVNDCEQEASWKEWQVLAAKHPEDQGLQALHALRIGICVKIKRDELSVQQGADIFEKARQALLIEWKEAAQPHKSKLLKP